jgi:MIP family channel proteins
MQTGLLQKLVAEFIGTFALIFIGVGSICADFAMKAGNNSAPGLGLLGIAVAHGLAIGIMVTAVGHISGGHLNPAVTIGLWVTKKIGTVEGLLYWVAQLAGGAAAAYLLTWILPEDVWRGVSLGVPALASGFPRANAMALEAVLTFFLVWAVFATAVDERGAFGKIAGFAIGLTVTMDILLGGPFTGAAMNPARAFGPALAGNYWAAQGVYWVGPLFGGAVAGALYDALYLKKRSAE